ncbi:hypothetical protein E4U53_004818 [Claviceps sorghi]|nr:hypothetical protein E4U53_004818 [Claviceps sorghi]
MVRSPSPRRRNMRDDVAALVDFLRNQPPPPDNFMSLPYEHMDDEPGRGRWSKIKSMAKRSKSMPREPRQLRLPDSAVAGVTIDGHRHIAISIPWEAAPFPFGPDARGQDPVSTPEHDAQDPAQAGMRGKDAVAVRTCKNERGIVTVLRPVTEAHGAGHGPAAGRPSSPRCAQSRGPRPPQDYIGLLPTSLDTPVLDHRSAPWQAPWGQQKTFQRSAYPARASSMTFSRSTRRANATAPAPAPASIDGILQPQESPADRPMDKGEGGSSQATPLDAMRCRKAAVRDKKRRDLDAMRHAKSRGRQADSETLPRGKAQPPPTTRCAATRLLNEGQESRLPDTVSAAGPTLTLSKLMVVMNMEPMFDMASAAAAAAAAAAQTRASQAPGQEPGMPTPPTSAHGSPPQKHHAPDPTSPTECREHGLRDLERRLRRLERNNDMWLRALVPLLESIHSGRAAEQEPDCPCPCPWGT